MKNKNMRKSKINKVIYSVGKIMKSDCDVNGSYTGNPQKGEKPVQDADDL